jgi:hypothetical protein
VQWAWLFEKGSVAVGGGGGVVPEPLISNALGLLPGRGLSTHGLEAAEAGLLLQIIHSRAQNYLIRETRGGTAGRM